MSWHLYYGLQQKKRKLVKQGDAMSVKEEWSQLRQTAKIMACEAQIGPFCDWANAFAESEKEKGKSGAYNRWLEVPEQQRKADLRSLLEGKVVTFGTGPQLEAVMLASLFHIMTFGRCIVSTAMRVDAVLMRKITSSFDELDGIPIRHVGNMAGVHSSLTFNACVGENFPLIFGDYYMLVTAIHSKPEAFPQGLPILFLEIDYCLYANRLIFYDRGIPHSSGMIYRTNPKKIPQWLGNPNVYDAPDDLRNLRMEIGGSVGYLDSNSARELSRQLPYLFKEAAKPTPKVNYTAFAFRTNEERCATLAKDVLKCTGDAVIFFSDDAVGEKLLDELKKSGQDVVLAKDSEDMVTALATGQGKHVVVSRLLSSTLFPEPEVRRPGTLFLADLFMTDIVHTKIFEAGDRLIQQHQPKLYFSLDDKLIKIYEEKGGFEKFFAIMDFTEKYDPWRQIRRVLAKQLLKRLAKIRAEIMDDNLPIPTTSLQNRRQRPSVETAQRGVAKAVKLTEGLCFCGSGKPFKECHGKPRPKK